MEKKIKNGLESSKKTHLSPPCLVLIIAFVEQTNKQTMKPKPPGGMWGIVGGPVGWLAPLEGHPGQPALSLLEIEGPTHCLSPRESIASGAGHETQGGRRSTDLGHEGAQGVAGDVLHRPAQRRLQDGFGGGDGVGREPEEEVVGGGVAAGAVPMGRGGGRGGDGGGLDRTGPGRAPRSAVGGRGGRRPATRWTWTSAWEGDNETPAEPGDASGSW